MKISLNINFIRTIKVALFPLFLLIFITNISAQSYTLNFKDPTTYTTTCGSVNPAQWEVKNDSCILFTPVFYPDPDAGTGDSIMVSFTIRINQSGNLNPDDNAYIHQQINGGTYRQARKYDGNTVSCVFIYTDSMKVAKTDNFRFRIALQNNSKTNFWQIKDGDIQINNVKYGGAMPVEFLNVNAASDNDHIDVSWKTASETNNDFFTIERSTDGTSFEALSTLNGAGNSNTTLEYSFKDVDPINGVSFYRIKQTDFDGRFDYSEIKVVRFAPEETGFSVFPNPVKTGESIQFVPLNSNDNYTVAVYSLSGQKFSEYTANGSSSVTIDESIPKGVYYVIISDDTEKHIEKIVVQ